MQPSAWDSRSLYKLRHHGFTPAVSCPSAFITHGNNGCSHQGTGGAGQGPDPRRWLVLKQPGELQAARKFRPVMGLVMAPGPLVCGMCLVTPGT